MNTPVATINLDTLSAEELECIECVLSQTKDGQPIARVLIDAPYQGQSKLHLTIPHVLLKTFRPSNYGSHMSLFYVQSEAGLKGVRELSMHLSGVIGNQLLFPHVEDKYLPADLKGSVFSKVFAWANLQELEVDIITKTTGQVKKTWYGRTQSVHELMEYLTPQRLKEGILSSALVHLNYIKQPNTPHAYPVLQLKRFCIFN